LNEGYVELVPQHSGFVAQRLQVATQAAGFEFDKPLQWAVYSNRGQRSEKLNIGLLPEAEFRTSDLILPDRESFELEQDATPGEPYSRSEEHTSELQSRFDLVC